MYPAEVENTDKLARAFVVSDYFILQMSSDSVRYTPLQPFWADRIHSCMSIQTATFKYI